jgi:hypothetical protein
LAVSGFAPLRPSGLEERKNSKRSAANRLATFRQRIAMYRHDNSSAIADHNATILRKTPPYQDREKTMFRGLIIASAAVIAVAAFTAVSQPASAGTCVAVSAKGRGVDDAAATKRAQKNLTNRINHWAHKNKASKIRVGKPATKCGKGFPGSICTATAKVCG